MQLSKRVSSILKMYLLGDVDLTKSQRGVSWFDKAILWFIVITLLHFRIHQRCDETQTKPKRQLLCPSVTFSAMRADIRSRLIMR